VGRKEAVVDLAPSLGERHLSVLNSKIHGRGLFTGNYIPKGEMIIEYTGEVSGAGFSHFLWIIEN
jgi:SET domain-containing protein